MAFDTTVPIATDDFESGGWAGGAGWLYDWYHTGDLDAQVTTSGTPYEGSYHLLLRDNSGAYVDRAVDLSAYTTARLQFQAKTNSFEAGEEAYCYVSANGTDWTTVHTWVNGDDDNTYHFFDIDLSPYGLTSEFWIAFEADMSGNQDYFYVDDIKIVGPPRYGIISRAGDGITKAVVKIEDGVQSLILWWVK